MNKISLIIQREYLTRVKKKSFIIMTFLGPILMAALFIAPILMGQLKDTSVKSIRIIDETGLFEDKFQDSETLTYDYRAGDIEKEKANLKESDYYAILHIPKAEKYAESGTLYTDQQPGMNILNQIKRPWKKEVEKQKLVDNGIDKNMLQAINTRIELNTINRDAEGNEEESFAEVNMAVGLVFGLLIYFFIFIFGAQVMKGVLEEKTSRIVEVIISSVKPFQLMMGKIVGIAMVGLTQFTLWLILTGGIYAVFTSVYAGDLTQANPTEMVMGQDSILPTGSNPISAEASNPQIAKAFNMINSIDFTTMLLSFLFYFIFGYLMYAALFAAVGAAADNDTDTQQFMVPITIPLILSIMSVQFVVMNPHGPLAYWLSIIPLTSPIVMLVRMPFEVPVWDIVVSMVVLILSIIGTTWMASKIYRTGILMYGKKVSYKELWKWLRY